jgi:signal transduction histidine kinase
VRVRLRWKILLFTALAPVLLAIGTLWTVNHNVSGHLEDSIHESLRRSARVFENMLAARADALDATAQVIVRDPRFFSILTLSASSRDPQYRATVRGVAQDFHDITQSDLFEVLDRRGGLLASVGRASSSAKTRDALVRAALPGRLQSGILVEEQHHFQVTVTPVVAGGRVVGALVLGAEIGSSLARRLRGLTHSEVTFVSGVQNTGSTLIDSRDRQILLRALEKVELGDGENEDRGLLELQGAAVTYLTLVRRIPGSDLDGRQLFVLQRSLEIETAFLREVQGGLVQLGVLAILAALIMGFTVSERITRPVLKMVRGAEEMERGNYDYPLSVQSQDEIGYLAERFRDMRQRQKDYITSLEEVTRLKSEFISIASHELRTPISVIKGFVELFSQGSLGALTPDQKEALAAIDRSLGNLTRIAEDATRVAQIEGEHLVLTLERQEVEPLVRDAVDMAAGDAPNRDLSITTVVEPGLPAANVDGPRLTQALANLVRNAIRFTPDGGSIEVQVARDAEDLVLSVKDTGVGIAHDQMRDLFTRPLAARDSLHHHSSGALEFNSAGLGLGLMLARGVVEAHGGAIEATSSPGKGSTFTIRVPFEVAQRMDQAA